MKTKPIGTKIKQKTVGAGPVSAQKGVTLLVLVIAIIIMLILAGVTLNLTLGDRGIFNTAKSTKDIQKIAEYKERVEISRAGTAVDNLGIVTLDNLTNQIYKEQVVPEGSIRKIDEEKAKMTTPEGYVFIITADKIEYIDKEDAIPVPPDLTEANVEFKLDPADWTKETVKITIKQTAGDKFTIEYSTDAKEWKEYTKEIETNKNTIIYARLKNPIGVAGNYASRKITTIDKLDPIKIIPTITATTNTITIDAGQARDATATSEDGCSGIKEIWYSKDAGSTSTWQTNEDKTITTYQYTELPQNTPYNIQVKVIDNAGNEMTTEIQNITTKTVDIAEGNVTINEPTWDASTHTASVSITKGSTVASGLQIQYQVNSTTGSWTTGTSKSGLKLNDTVYARLWDGTNGGAYTSLKITESTPPTVTVNITGTSTNSITASASAVDNQSGMPASPTYTFFIKKASEADSAYVEKHTGTETSFTFTGLAQTTEYTVKVETKDNAENKGAGTKAGKTGTVTIAEGNVTIGAPTWNASTHTASVSITKGTGVASGLQIQYQVNSTTGSWTTGTSKSGLKLNDTVYARLWDGTNGGAYTSLKITESTAPTVTVNITGTSTNSITASASAVDNQSGMPASPTYIFYLKKASEADSAYVEKHTGTETSFTFTGLAQTTEYTVKVETKDNAGNKGAGTKAGKTGTVTIAEGNVTIGAPTWNATAHTATVAITKGTGVASGLQIQYQVNSTSGTWTTGTSKSGLKLNDTVYARLWDGTNGGAYTSLKITESTAPTVTVNITGTSTNSITASASAVDNQSGMPASPTYIFYLKKASEADSAYVEKHTGTETSFTFTGLAQTTEYTVKVETKDNAGNKGAGTKAGKTGTVTIAEGNVTIGNPSWDASTHTASVSLTKGTGVSSALSIQYQVNSTTGSWTTGTSKSGLKLNDTVYARLWDGTNGGAYTSLKITESTAPTVTVNITGTSTNSITASATSKDDQSGMPASPTYTFYLKKASEADSAYVEKHTGTETSFTFTGLAQTTEYTVKVETKDNAGNKGAGTKAGKTGTVTIAEGNVTIGAPTWNATAHTATVAITKGTGVASGLQIQYQVNSTTGSWTTGTSKSGLKLNDTVYARLWDGTNGGAYTSLKITESTAPTVTVNITGTSTNSITASASAVDNQSGMPASPTYTFFIKKASEADSAYVEKHTGTETSFTFTGLAQTTEYTVKVETKDNAGNVGTAIKTQTTGTTVASEGNITFALSPTGWTNGSVTVTGTSKVSGYTIQVSTSTTFPTKADEVKSVTVSANQTVYARLVDSTNQANGYATVAVTTIDTTKPTINTALNNKSKTTNSMVMSMRVTDAQSGLSKIIWYYKLSTATNYTSVTVPYTAMNGSTAGTQTAVTTTHTFSDLAAGTYNVYAEAYDVAGNKTKSDIVNVTLNTITVTASISPTTWTIGDVTVTLTAANGGTIYYGTSETAMNTKYTAPFKQASNATIYYYVTDGTNKTAAGTLKITNIDKKKPVVTAATPTTNSVAIKATDEASGIIGYAVTTSTTAPTSFTSCTNTKSLSTTVSNLTQNKAYYVWVKDEAGNVSASKSFTTGQVAASEGNITFALSPDKWTSGDVTVTGTSKVSGYTIQVSKNTTFPSTATEVKSVTVSANQTVYARLVDSTNQANGYATVAVTIIDKTTPTITGATPTKNSVSITATDVGSGIVGYAVTTSSTAPTSFTSCPSTTSLSTTVSDLAQGTTYYAWVKDAVGKVSESKSFTTLKQAVTGITLNKTSITMAKNATETITATVAPTDAYNKTVTWSSSNTNVATVSNGSITAVGTGTTKITATAQDGSGKSATCTVTVKAVAQIGSSTYYTSVQAALNAANNNATIVLLENTNESVTTKSENYILDLNGKTLNGVLANMGSFHIKNGKMIGRLDNHGKLWIDNNAEVTGYDDDNTSTILNRINSELVVSGKVFDHDHRAITNMEKGAKTTIQEGARVESDNTVWATCGDNGQENTYTVNGGTIYGKTTVFNVNSKLIIKGPADYKKADDSKTTYISTVSDGKEGDNTIVLGENAECTISGGMVRSLVHGCAISNKGTLKMTGGYVLSNSTELSKATIVSSSGSVTITGGGVGSSSVNGYAMRKSGGSWNSGAVTYITKGKYSGI